VKRTVALAAAIVLGGWLMPSTNVTKRIAGDKALEARLWLLGVLAVALVVLVALAVVPPLPEPHILRALVDERAFLGIANFLNVVSNVPLLLVGAWGLHFLTRGRPDAFADPAEKRPYALLFLAVALTAFGSAYYHLAPDDDTGLMWDRLPMSVAFMALLSAVLVERINAKAGLGLLVPLAVIGAASVVHWRWSILRGAEDILPYAVVQYGGIAVIVALALAFPSRYTRGGDLIVAGALYALAKTAEMLDAQIYALGHIVSGHTLKHLVAAVSVAWLVRMLALRGQTRS
jgi:hypothetical protein